MDGPELWMTGCCARCRNHRDVFVPCDWLEEQQVLVLSCPHFEPMKEEKENVQHEVRGILAR